MLSEGKQRVNVPFEILFFTAEKKIQIFFQKKLPVKKTVVYLQPLRQTVTMFIGRHRGTGEEYRSSFDILWRQRNRDKKGNLQFR
ncbi:hypothetical protein B4Q04_22275 [Zobellia sp. OII3]|nr:hypothetical protein B4Q04_22275 [Zobellia sp. OII3]